MPAKTYYITSVQTENGWNNKENCYGNTPDTFAHASNGFGVSERSYTLYPYISTEGNSLPENAVVQTLTLTYKTGISRVATGSTGFEGTFYYRCASEDDMRSVVLPIETTSTEATVQTYTIDVQATLAQLQSGDNFPADVLFGMRFVNKRQAMGATYQTDLYYVSVTAEYTLPDQPDDRIRKIKKQNQTIERVVTTTRSGFPSRVKKVCLGQTVLYWIGSNG